MSDKFLYATYIRTTPEKLWDALTKPEFTRLYWRGMTQECEWKKGASWRLVFSDGRVADAGSVVEIERPKRLVLAWRNEFQLRTQRRRVLARDLRARADGRHGEAHHHA